MSWFQVISALQRPGAPTLAWPDEHRRVVRKLGFDGQPCWSAPPPAQRRPAGSPGQPRPRVSDEALIQALKSGRATGPTSLSLLLGIAPSTGHRRLAELVRRGRLERESWNCWRVVG